ncbi:hypothetical protein F0562_005489 [Nyssa sinensis]|uniref:SOSEKI DIX-like domain-containing protein n=1 Tax=Nyssa sinensis TaxID=561372 RepID=A0A5J5AN82_9ASTE|nr:hypothetical protein F0562_005489 [Nyssa sinensis]
MDVRGRRCRESSPDRAQVCVKPRVVKPTFRKVQVVYYLSRNGQLEHPHYMEVTHLAHQQLRLKDVMDRLTVLRGKGMPSLYSWSCKRSYKNGYVWNDLAENDIIYPSEGAEYVLKGSELIEGSTEKFQELQVSNRQQIPGPILHPKRKPLAPKRHSEPEEVDNNRYEDDEDDDNEEEEEEDGEKTIYTSSNTANSRCSRGVSTDEIELQQHETHKNNPTTELTLENSSPPSTTSSTISDKANESNNTSKRFEDGDPVATDSDSVLSRNSMLLQLIACGGSVSFRGKGAPVVKQQPPITVGRKSSSLHKGVLCKTAVAKVVVEEDDEISCMSENPRFGNLQSEEKEFFSGSIVESMTEERGKVEPTLKKSSSFNEERSSKAGLEEAAVEELKREKGVKGKCIPIKKSSSKQSKK